MSSTTSSGRALYERRLKILGARCDRYLVTEPFPDRANHGAEIEFVVDNEEMLLFVMAEINFQSGSCGPVQGRFRGGLVSRDNCANPLISPGVTVACGSR